MKLYVLSLSLLLCSSAQSMWRVTATLPQDNGQTRVVEFDIDSHIVAQEISCILRLPYSQPTVENIRMVQNAHIATCRELNKEYTPLSDQEARNLYEQQRGEQMLEAIKMHQPQLYPGIIGILAAKTSINQAQFRSGA